MDAHNFHGSHMWNPNNIREDDYTVENLVDQADHAINSPTQAGVATTIGHCSEPGINTPMFLPNDGDALPQRDYECMSKRPMQPQPHDLALRKKISRAQDIMLKCMQELKEKCDIEGFVYGIIQKKGKMASSSSDNLQWWWKKKVQFDCNGPLAIAKYQSENASDGTRATREASGLDILFEFHDTTLGSLLSTLMRYCDPPQRLFPIEKGALPPWWPTGGEEWWPQLRMPRNLGAPPYKKPHNLKKAWKISVLTAVVKHLIPNVHNFAMLANSSKFLQLEKMNAKEISIWLRYVEYEAKLYMQQHPDVQLPLSTLRREHGSVAFNCSGEYDPNYQMLPSGVGSSSNNHGDDFSGLGFPGDGQQVIGGLMGCYNHEVGPEESLLNPAEQTNFQHAPEMPIESDLYRQNHELGVSMLEAEARNMSQQSQHVPTSENITVVQDYENNMYPGGIHPGHMMPIPQDLNTSNDYGWMEELPQNPDPEWFL